MHLDDLLALIMEHDMILNLELKNGETNYPGLEGVVVKHICQMHAQERVFLSSFNHISMKRCKDIDPSIRTGLLYSYPLIGADKYAAEYGIDALHPKYTCLHLEPELVKRSHLAGLLIHTWTVNEEDEMHFCIRQGVDSIISNYPDLLIDVMKGL